jgi:hypothetical protein
MKNIIEIGKIIDRINLPLAIIVWPVVLSDLPNSKWPHWIIIALFIISVPGIIKSLIIWVKSVHLRLDINWFNK